MMVIGIDPHKQSHTAVAADELGRKKAQHTSARHAPGYRLPQSLRALWLAATARLTGRWRPEQSFGRRADPHGGRDRGKSDPIDALAIARLALREGAGLPAPASMSRSWRCGG